MANSFALDTLRQAILSQKVRESHGPSRRAVNLRLVRCALWMPDDYPRPIEPLITVVLVCMRWKSAQVHEVQR